MIDRRLRACEKYGRRSEGVSGRSRPGTVRESGASLEGQIDRHFHVGERAKILLMPDVNFSRILNRL